MTEQNTPEIPDDGRVLAALGINPDNVAKGSFKIHWTQDGQPAVEFTVLQRVSTATLARAFAIAAHPGIPEDAEGEKTPDEGDVSRETSQPPTDLASRRRPQPDEAGGNPEMLEDERPEPEKSSE